MADILLTHGYFLHEDPAERRIMRPYPPLGILSISSYLKARGFAVEVFDSTFSSREAFRTHLSSSRPRLVGIYVNLMTKLNVLGMIRECKRHGATVIVGGPEVPNYAAEFLRHGADVAVIGEGELTLEELIPAFARGGTPDLRGVTGIVTLDPEGNVVRNPERPLIPDLDALPLPDRGAIRMADYIDTWRAHHGLGSVSLICSRGCPFTCTWCSRSVFGDTHRRRSPGNVADEIERIMAEYRPDQLWFADDVFTINHRWFHQFHAEMKRRGLRVPFECISRADRLNDEILGMMKEIGSFRIWFGSESGSQRILDAMQRKVTVEKIREVTAQARKHGIESGFFVMLGYPGEEIADIDATIRHLKESRPDLYLTTVAYPIKGTAMYDEVKDRLLGDGDWETITDRQIGIRGRHSDRFYWFATRHMVNEVRWDKLRGSRHAPAAAAALVKSRVARLGMHLTAHERT